MRTKEELLVREVRVGKWLVRIPAGDKFRHYPEEGDINMRPANVNLCLGNGVLGLGQHVGRRTLPSLQCTQHSWESILGEMIQYAQFRNTSSSSLQCQPIENHRDPRSRTNVLKHCTFARIKYFSAL